MSDIICQISQFNEALVKPITVGEEVNLVCQGNFPEGFKVESAKFKFEKNQKYLLKILKAENHTEKNEIRFTLVSYVPGQHKLDHLILADEGHLIDLGNFALNVESVIQQDKSQGPVEPYGPFGPFQREIPILLWIYLGFIFFSFVATFIVTAIIKLKYKKLLKLMSQFDVNVTPSHAYYQYFRKIQRQNASWEIQRKVLIENEKIQILDEIDQQMDIYLYRVFNIPSIYLNKNQILKKIKKINNEAYNFLRRSYSDFKNEIKSSKKLLQKLNLQDLNQILVMSQKIVDEVDKIYFNKNGKGGINK